LRRELSLPFAVDCSLHRTRSFNDNGYGFGDRHINNILLKAAEVKAKFFIVDVAGIEVIDKRKGQDQIAQRLWDALAPQIIGASRRLTTTFGVDRIEYAKLQCFFAS
jgi:hypothetical protein